MQRKHRNGRTSTKMSLEHEIAHLRGLDLKGLRSRWQSIFQRSAPAHLTRHLLFAVIAYRIQADRFGDLDHETIANLRNNERNYRSDNPVSVGRHMHLLGRRDAKLGLARERIFRLDVPIEVNFRG
jgi:Protein of unknown function (DUF2924)